MSFGFNQTPSFQFGQVTINTQPAPVPPSPVVEAGPQKGSLASDLSALLESPEGADVSLVVGDAVLPAHSQILAARSPVFAAMLRSDMKESRTRQIDVRDMRETVLRQLLSFIYTDTAPELDSVAEELLPMAEKYDLPLLKRRCEDKLAQELSVENAAACAVLAVLHRCARLRAAAAQFVAGHPQVLATGGWARLLRAHPEVAVEFSQLLAAELAARIKREDPVKQSKFGGLS